MCYDFWIYCKASSSHNASQMIPGVPHRIALHTPEKQTILPLPSCSELDNRKKRIEPDDCVDNSWGGLCVVEGGSFQPSPCPSSDAFAYRVGALAGKSKNSRTRQPRSLNEICLNKSKTMEDSVHLLIFMFPSQQMFGPTTCQLAAFRP